MSRSQVVSRRRFVCDELLHHNIFIRLPCDRILKVSARLFIQAWHEFWRLDKYFERKTVNRQFTRPHALGIASGLGPVKIIIGNITSFTNHVETDCIIQDHQIIDNSQIFLVCSFRCTCLFQAAHVMLVREISATVRTVTMSVCVSHAQQPRALFLPEHYYTIQAPL